MRLFPFVGAAAVKGEEILEIAHRGELDVREHAEYTLLERKLKDIDLTGCTIYATLEPCTERGQGKIPCAKRIIDRNIAKVYIGMVDPNPDIRGHGIRMLRNAGIEVQLFPSKFGARVEDLNGEFIRYFDPPRSMERRSEAAEKIQDRSLDTWYLNVNRVYWNRNFLRSRSEILLHLVEIIGGLSHLVSNKSKSGITAESYIPKAIAWWLALCGKAGINSVESMVWTKFPKVCTYCLENPHNPELCKDAKLHDRKEQWKHLGKLGEANLRPRNLSEWQRMFDEIYPSKESDEYGPTFARLSEELGELAEAIRVFSSEPGYFLSEACDVFAWLMHLANLYETKNGVPTDKRYSIIGFEMAMAYPDYCPACLKRICSCPPILKTTIGRIVHEVPPNASYSETFMSSDQIRTKFNP